MTYQIELLSGKILVFNKEKLFLKNILSSIVFYGTGTIYNHKNIKLLKYYIFTFIFIYIIKIIENKSNLDIKIINHKSWNYKIKINENIYEIKYKFFSFMKNCCIILRNNIEIGYVYRELGILPRKMSVEFLNDDKKIQYEALISLLINLTNDEDV